MLEKDASKVQQETDQFFSQEWSTYQKVVAGDHLEHRALLETARQALLQRCEGSISLLDLGCGDASPLVSLLKQLSPQVTVGSYTGVDLSPTALQVVLRNIQTVVVPPVGSTEEGADPSAPVTPVSAATGPAPGAARPRRSMPAPVHAAAGVLLYQEDMLQFLKAAPTHSYHVVYSAFAVHHLDAAGKRDLLREVARVLKPGGCFLHIDVFLQHEEQTRCEYLALYLPHMLLDWTLLEPAERERSIVHVASFDHPVSQRDYGEWATGCFASTAVLHAGRFSRCVLSTTEPAVPR